MPQNKRESLIYSVMMCFCMVLWMSIYNVSLHQGGLSLQSIQTGWLGFPIAYIFAFCCDWFLVSKLAKGVAFGFLLRPESSPRRKVLTISTCMVVPMVVIMSLYGAAEGCVHTGLWATLPLQWFDLFFAACSQREPCWRERSLHNKNKILPMIWQDFFGMNAVSQFGSRGNIFGQRGHHRP